MPPDVLAAGDRGREPHVPVIVVHTECDYRAPATFGDQVDVRMNIGDIGRTSFSLVFEAVNAATGARLAEGKAVMVAYDYKTAKPVPLPAETRALAREIEEIGELPGGS